MVGPIPLSKRRSASAPALPTAPSANERLLRALSAPDLQQAAKTYVASNPRPAAAAPAPAAAPAGEAVARAGERTHDQLAARTTAANNETRWQAFLTNPTPGTNVAVALAPIKASADNISAAAGSASVAIDRASAAASYGLGGSDTVTVAQNPAITSASYSHAIGGPAAATVGASLYTNGKVFGANVSTGVAPASLGQTIGFSAGLTAVTDNTIEVLGTERPGPGGTTERLARLKSEFMPILDVSASTAAAHVSLGARLTAFGGKSGTMEKFIEVKALAAMLRQRSAWYGPVLTTAAALGVKVGVKLPTAAKLADDIVRGGGLGEGESYEFTRQKGLTFGVSAGAMGVKATVNVTTQAGTTLALKRTSETHYELTVTPSKVKAVSGGVDASVAAEAFVSLSHAMVQRRTWAFDTSREPAREALARALGGDMPGSLLADSSVSHRQLQSMQALQRDESLPEGVTAVSSALGEHTERAGGVSALRPLASTGLAAGLAAIRSGFEVSHGLTEGHNTLMDTTVGSRRTSEKLLRGARTESVAATVRQLTGPGGGGDFAGLTIGVDLSLRDGSGTGRQPLVNVAARLSDRTLGKSAQARRSDNYSVRATWELGAADLRQLATASAESIKAAAGRSGIAAHHISALVASLNDAAPLDGAQANASNLTRARIVAQFVKGGRSEAVVALRHLLGEQASAQMAFSSSNSRLERTKGKFLAAHTMQQGAVTTADVRKVAKRMSALSQRIGRQIAELKGDAVMNGLLPNSSAEQVELLAAVKDSATKTSSALVDKLKKAR